MITCVVHHANGTNETVDVEIIDAGSGRLETDVVDNLASFEPPLGTIRLPTPGEVWRNRNGALVAVMSAASILDGGYNVVTLTKSESARNPGHVYTVNLDGVIFTRLREAGGDLISYVTRFDS